MKRIYLPLLAAMVALTLAWACQGEGTPPTPPPQTGNLFQNPSLEEGHAPWYSLRPPDFIVSEDVAHSGKYSALLRMRDPPEVAGDAKVYYLVQELVAQEFPEIVSGFYRVENWKKGTEKQYLQFVVIVFGAKNLPAEYSNHQIRYLLAGIDKEPFPIANAFFVFIDREEPRTGQWVPFKRNIREDFQRLWGAVPQGFDYIRVLFEVRWDDKKVGEGPAEADVYYDDLYMGPALAPGQ